MKLGREAIDHEELELQKVELDKDRETAVRNLEDLIGCITEHGWSEQLDYLFGEELRSIEIDPTDMSNEELVTALSEFVAKCKPKKHKSEEYPDEASDDDDDPDDDDDDDEKDPDDDDEEGDDDDDD